MGQNRQRSTATPTTTSTGLGNHGYLVDPTHNPTWSEESYSGGELAAYAWRNWRS